MTLPEQEVQHLQYYCMAVVVASVLLLLVMPLALHLIRFNGHLIYELLSTDAMPCQEPYQFVCQSTSRSFRDDRLSYMRDILLKLLHGEGPELPDFSEAARKRLPPALGLGEWPVRSAAGLPRISFVAAKLGQVFGEFPLVAVGTTLKDDKKYITEPDTVRDVFHLDKFRFKEENLLRFLDSLAAANDPKGNRENAHQRMLVLRGALELETKVAQWDWEEFLRILLKDLYDEDLNQLSFVVFPKRFVSQLMQVLRRSEMTHVMTLLGFRAALSLLPVSMAGNRDQAFLHEVLAARYAGKLENYCAESTFNVFQFHFLSLFANSKTEETLSQFERHIKTHYVSPMRDFFASELHSPATSNLIATRIPVMQQSTKYNTMLLVKTVVSSLELAVALKEPGDSASKDTSASSDVRSPGNGGQQSASLAPMSGPISADHSDRTTKSRMSTDNHQAGNSPVMTGRAGLSKGGVDRGGSRRPTLDSLTGEKAPGAAKPRTAKMSAQESTASGASSGAGASGAASSAGTSGAASGAEKSLAFERGSVQEERIVPESKMASASSPQPLATTATPIPLQGSLPLDPKDHRGDNFRFRYDMEPMRAIPDTTTVAPEAQNDADVWRNLPNKSQQQAEPPPPGFLYGATDQPPSGATATSVIDGGRGESLRGARSSTLRAEAGSVGSTAGPLWTERPFDETAGTSARPRTFGRADEDYASHEKTLGSHWLEDGCRTGQDCGGLIGLKPPAVGVLRAGDGGRPIGCFFTPPIPSVYEINETTNCISDGCRDFDFYAHVCGGWINTTDIPSDAVGIDVLSEAQMALNLEVMELRNSKGTKPLEKLLARLGIPRWPIVESNFQADVMGILANVTREIGVGALLTLRVGPEQTNNRRNVIYLDQPSFGVEHAILRARYRSPYFRILHRYKLYAYRCALLLGATVAAADLVNEIVGFEIRLAQLSEMKINPGFPLWIKSDGDLNEHYKDIPDLRKEDFFVSSLLVIKAFIRNGLRKLKYYGHDKDYGVLRDVPVMLDLTDKVMLRNQRYLRALSQLLQEESTRRHRPVMYWPDEPAKPIDASSDEVPRAPPKFVIRKTSKHRGSTPSVIAKNKRKHSTSNPLPAIAARSASAAKQKKGKKKRRIKALSKPLDEPGTSKPRSKTSVTNVAVATSLATVRPQEATKPSIISALPDATHTPSVVSDSKSKKGCIKVPTQDGQKSTHSSTMIAKNKRKHSTSNPLPAIAARSASAAKQKKGKKKRRIKALSKPLDEPGTSKPRSKTSVTNVAVATSLATVRPQEATKPSIISALPDATHTPSVVSDSKSKKGCIKVPTQDGQKSTHSSTSTTAKDQSATLKNLATDDSYQWTNVLLAVFVTVTVLTVVASIVFPNAVKRIVSFFFNLDHLSLFWKHGDPDDVHPPGRGQRDVSADGRPP
ncbi:endothelin-converting enzyme, putative, partial [Ixodes scapularis]